MKGRTRFTTTMSFVLVTPLLSPYILVLSFSVLGFHYGMLNHLPMSPAMYLKDGRSIGPFGPYEKNLSELLLIQ